MLRCHNPAHGDASEGLLDKTLHHPVAASTKGVLDVNNRPGPKPSRSP